MVNPRLIWSWLNQPIERCLDPSVSRVVPRVVSREVPIEGPILESLTIIPGDVKDFAMWPLRIQGSTWKPWKPFVDRLTFCELHWDKVGNWLKNWMDTFDMVPHRFLKLFLSPGHRGGRICEDTGYRNLLQQRKSGTSALWGKSGCDFWRVARWYFSQPILEMRRTHSSKIKCLRVEGFPCYRQLTSSTNHVWVWPGWLTVGNPVRGGNWNCMASARSRYEETPGKPICVSDAKIIAGPGRDLKYLKLKLVVLGWSRTSGKSDSGRV